MTAFNDMVKEMTVSLQKQIYRETAALEKLAAPIIVALKEQRIRYGYKFLCAGKVPTHIKIETSKPRITVHVSKDGYTFYERNSPWPYRYAEDVPLTDALRHLAAIIAKTKVVTPCK